MFFVSSILSCAQTVFSFSLCQLSFRVLIEFVQFVFFLSRVGVNSEYLDGF